MAQFQLIKPNTNIQFIANHKVPLVLLMIFALISLVSSYIISPNWGTSFSGGTAITIHFDEFVEPQEVRRVFDEDPRFESVSVQSVGAEAEISYVVRTRTTTTLNCHKLADVKSGLPAAIQASSGITSEISQWPSCDPEIEDGIRGDFFLDLVSPEDAVGLRTPVLVDADVLAKAFQAVGLKASVSFEEQTQRYLVKPLGIQNEVESLLSESFGDSFNPTTGVDGIVTVGADVGDKFRIDAIFSILLALGLMFIYIAMRFDSRYAPAAVFSLAVTTITAFGVVVFMQMEITLETVAAMLSLVGYGINDTIVNFDRIRENLGISEANVPLAETINKSINECLSRTVMTSLTTLAAIGPMALLATGATQDFAIIMSIGIILATINSIAISCPSLLYIDAWFTKYQKRVEMRKAIEEDLTVEA